MWPGILLRTRLREDVVSHFPFIFLPLHHPAPAHGDGTRVDHLDITAIFSHLSLDRVLRLLNPFAREGSDEPSD
jgi:hypothetical protein